ncbi:MAG: DNA polymerase III subunit beta [Patescibacteria group bacterium]|nr:MAG: DNA polymerase III subunit beta [Patescibacteria group bacterium]
MKLECIKEKIKAYVSLADKTTSKNTTLPILESILLIAKNKTLRIISTNLDVGVEFEMSAKVEKEGRVAVPGSVLSNTLACLPDEKNLSLDLVNENLLIATKNNSILIKSYQSDDFPTLPKIKNGESFTVSAKKLLTGIKSVWYSSSVSDIKPEISSVFIYPESDHLVFVATDSFRLAEKRVLQKGIVHFSGIIMPFKNISEIIRVFEEIEGDIDITFNKNQISFYGNGVYLTSRVIDGIFPDYKQIIPKESSAEAVMLKQDLMDSLKIANIFSDKFNRVNIELDPQHKTFELNSKNETGENTTNIKATLSGDSARASFNYRYIMDCFQSIGSDSVAIQFSESEGNKMMIRGVGDNSFFYLVMPIHK